MSEKTAYYRKSVSETLKLLKTPAEGLTAAEAEERLKIHGRNEMPKEKVPSNFYLFAAQLKSSLVYILLFATLVSIFLREYIEAAIILVIVIVNATLGFFQEARAQRAMAALKRVFVSKAVVRRNGREELVDLEEIVPGDILVLRGGFRLPADARLIKAVDLEMNEAILTGESAAIRKTEEPLRGEKELGEQKNMVFAGTEVTGGHGAAIVIGTGTATEIGRIAHLIRRTEAPPTPLQVKISVFSRNLSLLTLSLALFLFGLGLAFGRPADEVFLMAVAVMVAAIPEGLLIALTVILAVGMQRILARQGLVREMLAAETLGSTTIICADKTGTLTEGIMSVVRFETVDHPEALRAATLCNNLDDAEEHALWERVKVADHFDPQRILEKNPRLAEIPFTSSRRFMATLNRVREGNGGDKGEEGLEIFAKGAPEIILSFCKVPLSDLSNWEAVVNDWAKEGLRILALAKKDLGADSQRTLEMADGALKVLQEQVGSGFTFLGLVGLADPIRSDVKQALEECRLAGIKVAVITGDYRATAERVLADLGLTVKPEEVLEGKEIENFRLEELKLMIGKIRLFARTTPEQKLKIVEALQSIGEVVAMTGDGVNDAPALKKADIGVVVGSGTTVAKETGDLVLLDNRFNTIVAAVEEGRNIVVNLKKVITYLLADSFAEILLVAGSLILGFPFFILPAQIIFISLIADGWPSFALAFEEKEKDLMKEGPTVRTAPILDSAMYFLIFVIGLVTNSLLFSLAFLLYRQSGGDLDYTRTVIFLALGTASLFYVFACRNLRQPFWRVHLFSNPSLNLSVVVGFILLVLAVYAPPFQVLLHTQPLGLEAWLLVLGMALFKLFAIEFSKQLFYRRRKMMSARFVPINP